MAEAEEAAPVPAEVKKEEKKEPPAYQSASAEMREFFKKAADAAIGVTALGTSSFLATSFGGLEGLVNNTILGLSYPLSGRARNKKEGKPFTSADYRNEFMKGGLGALLTTGSVWTAKEVAKSYVGTSVNVLGAALPYSAVVGGALTLGLTGVIAPIYQMGKYLIDNRKFEGMWKDYLKRDGQGIIYRGLINAGLVGASLTFTGFAPFLYPALALSNAMLRAKNPKPWNYISNLLYTPAGLASVGGKIYRGVNYIAEKAGEGLKKFIDYITPQPAKAEKPAPA